MSNVFYIPNNNTTLDMGMCFLHFKNEEMISGLCEILLSPVLLIFVLKYLLSMTENVISVD